MIQMMSKIKQQSATFIFPSSNMDEYHEVPLFQEDEIQLNNPWVGHFDVELSSDEEEIDACSPKRKRGKPANSVWSYLSDIEGVHKRDSAKQCTCKHCQLEVAHHFKASRVQGHLCKCPAFIELMQNTAEGK